MSLSNPLPRGTRQSPVYIADGVSATYAVPFWFLDVLDLVVTVTPPGGGAALTLSGGVGYTATGADNPAGGSVTLAAPIPAAGAFVRVFGRRVANRLTSVVNDGALIAVALEKELDALEATCQELRRDADAAVTFSGAGVVIRGQWTAGVAYVANDMVTHQGSSFRALTPSINVLPGTDASKWFLVAAKGDAGAADAPGLLDVSNYGVLPSNSAAVNVAAIEPLIAAAVAAGVTTFYVPTGEHDLTGVGSAIHKVRLVGPGTIKGVYRKQVERFRGANTFQSAQTLDPARHMRRFLATQNPVVVVVGDSLSVANEYDDVQPRNGIFEVVSRKLREAFPNKNITIHSRGIPGARYYDLDGVFPGAVRPAWYDNAAKPWLDYVEELTPHLVVCHFGMNDGDSYDVGNFPLANFFSAVDKMRGWQREADLVFCTPFAPSLVGFYPAGADYRSEYQQEGRDAVAGFLRGFCELGGYGYLDLNRWFNVLRDGRDVCSRGFVRPVVQQTTTIPFLPTKKTRDYSLWASFAAIPAGFWSNSGDILSIRLSPHAGNIGFITDAGGFLKIDLYVDAGLRVYSAVSAIATPATGSAVVFLIEVIGHHLKVYINGGVLYDGPVLRFGGEFFPYFIYAGNAPSAASGDFLLLSSADAPYPSVLLDTDIYGTMPGANLVNHPGGEALQIINREPFDAQPWTSAAIVTPEQALLDFLAADTGVAIDFVTSKYVIRYLTQPSYDAFGPASTIVANTLNYASHPVTGERLGLLLSGANVNHILLSAFPFLAGEGTLVVESYNLANAATIVATIGPSGDNGPRLVIASDDGSALTAHVIDDALTEVVSLGAVVNPYQTFVRSALSWRVNDFDFVANGHVVPAKDQAGAVPTGLDRIKLGYSSGPAAPNPVIIRRLALIPQKLDAPQLMTRTL